MSALRIPYPPLIILSSPGALSRELLVAFYGSRRIIRSEVSAAS
jgi:hypothetical protein